MDEFRFAEQLRGSPGPEGIGMHKHRDRPAVPGDRYFLATLYAGEQSGQLGAGSGY
jgi:hypothetical protein